MSSRPRHHLHFAPERGLFGDPMPFYWEGEYHVFYQNSPDGLSFEGMQWAHAVSTDLLTWRALPPALLPTPEGPDSHGCWTGCVIAHEGLFHAYYTGCSGPGGRGQSVCHAVSSDLVHWRKDPGNPLIGPGAPYAAGPYSAWRDPQVIAEPDGAFTMLLAADLPHLPPALRGCVARLISHDLSEWRRQQPLYAPSATPKCECPDLFCLGGRHWLLYSDFGPRLLSAPAPLGPFRPAGRLDDLRYYATRTVRGDGGRRVAFSFLAERSGDSDNGVWEWGGVMALPRELGTDEEGRLTMAPVAELAQARHERLALGLTALDVGHWTGGAGAFHGRPSSADEEFCLALIGAQPRCCELALTIDLVTAEAAGVAIGCDPELSSGYLVEVEPGRLSLSLSRFSASHETAPLLLQRVSLPEDCGRRISLRLILDADALEVFAHGRVCLSGRVQARAPGQPLWGLAVRLGEAEFTSVEAWSLSLVRPQQPRAAESH